MINAESVSEKGRHPPVVVLGATYEVRMVVELDDRTLRTTDEVLCQVQFTAETGWIVEDVSLDPN